MMRMDRRARAGGRRGTMRRLTAVGLFLTLGLLAAGPAAAQFFNAPTPSEEADNVFPPPDRELRQLVEGAKEAIAQERFGDAVEALNALLVDPQMEDYFLGSGEGTQLSLKAEARRLLGNLPPAGREAYEQKFGREARQMLDEAIQQANPERLSQVARLYFHSQAGMEAAMLLGRFHLNRGRPLAGALWLKRLTEASEQASKHGPAAAAYDPGAKYDPDLSILLAECWLEAGLNDSARQTLIELKQRTPEAKVRVGEQRIPLFAEDASALEWMDALLVARREGGARESDWTLFRGNPARNAETAGGFPLPQFVWQTPASNDPAEMEQIARLEKSEFRSAQVPALPAAQPLAIQDIVVMRTPEHVVGVDFRQGKRVWLFPAPNSGLGDYDHSDDALPMPQAEEERSKELKQRIWEDAPYGQLSSDGEAVYFVHELGFALEGMRPMVVGRGGQVQENTKSQKSFNQLVALDLRSEGKLRWIIDGKTGETEPRLAGAFFLGPPLPLSGQLYVLAEVNAEIRLVVLDARTGQLQWMQQLAHVDPSNATILHDAHRRLAGATPSFADGVLVCPTSAGAVVAVDVAARSLLWGYQYRRNTSGQMAPNAFGGHQQQPRDIGKRWADAVAVIADGRVLVTPVESEYLHCLDLLTGEMLWQQPRGESLFIGGVHDGRALVVGKTHIAALDVVTGKIDWKQEIGLPTGRGFLSDGNYYQPVYHTTASDAGEERARYELVQIDVETSDVAARVETDQPLGNLVCHRDQIVSQGAQWIGAVYQVEPLRRTVEERLKKDADDPWALARHAQLLRHDGKDQEALAALRRSYELAPEDYTRQLLIDTMLKFLAADFAAHREYVDEIQRLDPASDQRGEFLRLLIAGYQASGEPEKAFEACLKLSGLDLEGAAGPSRPPMDQIGAHLTVRRDRWIRARMQELIDAADGEH
ncbi:MAG: PQQ-like beta-propeller repeat protein, partial [Planctomycetes bacterium]|nr:PQQ-like beta-propeller repeat protein [Planctomycetota bacterium]